MKKYTIIYTPPRYRGTISDRPHMDQVETNDLDKLLEEEYNDNFWFVFEGWPKEVSL